MDLLTWKRGTAEKGILWKAFVDQMFAAFRDRFGSKRKDGARPLRGLAGETPEDRLFNFRQLRTGVFG